ncbi:MAG: TfoX/Sxy family DNA transformation protein [Rubrivivax sp.]|jgi:nucleotidyltransferase/DNA polymerase involved in DNA repair|nr:TfoX/Sxy family DNA transformation protein [Rubrivivax sp.]
MPFAAQERRRLLSTPGLGPRVIARLEAAGIESLVQLRAIGAEAAVARVCRQLGTQAWRNRLGALQGALQCAVQGAPDPRADT